VADRAHRVVLCFAGDCADSRDAYKRHDWLIGAVTKRLREEFAKLQVEFNDEPGTGRIARPSSKSGRRFCGRQGGVPPIPVATDWEGDKPDQSISLEVKQMGRAV
jgi:hypothetical protein